MSANSKYILLRLFSFFVALQVLNISTDTVGVGGAVIRPGNSLGSYNEMESLAELVLESVMQVKDAIPEDTSDPAPEEKSEKEIKLFAADDACAAPHRPALALTQPPLRVIDYKNIIAAITPPPPEA